MRILITGGTYAPALNGQAVFTTNLSEGLAKLGHKVLVVISSDKVHAYRHWMNKVQVEELSSVSLGWLHAESQFSPFPGKEVKRIYDTFNPEIVNIQDHYPLSRANFHIARKRGIKIVGSNHFMPENLAPYVPLVPKAKRFFNWVLWQWMLNLYNRMDAVAAQSKAAAALLRSQGLRVKVVPISCGLDLKRFCPNPNVDRTLYCKRYGLDPNQKIFLFVGRVDREKKVEVLMRAMQQLKRDDIQLAIAGRGTATSELQELGIALNLGERVRFTGFIPPEDLPALLNSVDIFTMPSEAELLSIATLEALACGRPILVADAVALPELVTNSVNGFAFRPGDPKDAARCMELLADQPERWPEMGKASLEIARTHGLDDTVGKYEGLYESVITAASSRKSSNQIITNIVR